MVKVKKIFYLFWLSLLIFLPAYCQVNCIAANVNGQIITKQEVEEYSRLVPENVPQQQREQQALEHLIEQKLILSEAEKEKVEIPQDWVENKLNELISQYPNYQEFEKELINQGLSINQLKENIRNDLMVREMVRKNVISQITVSPKEITEYYQEHIQNYSSPKKYVCWIAKSGKEDYLRKISSQLTARNVNQVIDENSDIFFRIESDAQGLKKEVYQAIKTMKPGEHVIRQIEGSYYLIYLAKIVPAYQKFLDEVKDEIYEIIWQDKFQKRFEEWINKLRRKALIKIYQLSKN